MNKFNKGKLIGFVAASLSAVSLVGVGFATWVIGTRETTSNGEVTITADNVEYKSFIVGVTFTENLKLAETSDVSANTYFNSNAADGKLAIKAKISFTLGKNFVDSDFTFNKIKFTIATDSALDNKPTDENKVHLSTRKYSEDLTYFNLPDDVAIAFDELKKDANQADLTKTYTVDKTLNFKWGSMFGTDGKSPCAYYEEEINKTTVTDKDTFMQQAGQELEDMKTKYNGDKKLKLKMELING